MKTYRSLTPAVYRSQLNLCIVTSAATREDETSVADVAREHDCSVRQVHALRRRVLDALAPRKPGPRRAGPIAMNAAVVRWVCAAVPEVEVAVTLVRQATPVAYRACVVGRFAVNGVANAGARIVVLDPRRAAAEAAERASALVRMEAALTTLAVKGKSARTRTPTVAPKKPVRAEEELAAAEKKRIAAHKKLAAAHKKLSALRTRHGLAARYLKTELAASEDVLTLTWQRDEEELAAAAQRDGRWPLVRAAQPLPDGAPTAAGRSGSRGRQASSPWARWCQPRSVLSATPCARAAERVEARACRAVSRSMTLAMRSSRGR